MRTALLVGVDDLHLLLRGRPLRARLDVSDDFEDLVAGRFDDDFFGIGDCHDGTISAPAADRAKMSNVSAGIDPSVPPSGAGCAECDEAGGWWFHLRRARHAGTSAAATTRWHATRPRTGEQPVIRSSSPLNLAKAGSGTTTPTTTPTVPTWHRPPATRLTRPCRGRVIEFRPTGS